MDPFMPKCASLCLNRGPPVCRWIGETCLCCAREGAACWSVPLWAKRAKGPRGARDKGTEGSGVTSCPCVDETMPSVNKPKLAVMTEVGWTKGKCLNAICDQLESIRTTLQWFGPFKPFDTVFIVIMLIFYVALSFRCQLGLFLRGINPVHQQLRQRLKGTSTDGMITEDAEKRSKA